MNLKDFKHYFSNTVVCKVENDYFYSSICIENKRTCLIRAIINDDSRGLTFSVNQMSDKCFVEDNQPGGKRIYELSRYKVLIIRKLDDYYIKIAGLYSIQ
jgi:hypothetical protein